MTCNPKTLEIAERQPNRTPMNLPSELVYTKEHEWVRVEDDVAVVGITDFAQGELGDVVYVEIESVDTEIDSDTVFGTVEAVKTVSELFAPVAGTIIEVNEQLEANPELVNSDPYGEGWMVKIRMTDPSATAGLMTSDAYQEMVGA